jgi:hypothetical protein
MGGRLGGWVAVVVGAFARIVLCGAVLAVPAAGQVVVRGVLYDDSTGVPVRGTVMFVDPRTDAPVVHAVSDSAGYFTLSGPAGVYQLAAVSNRYLQTLSAAMTLQDGERMTVRVPISSTGDTHHRIGVVQHEHGVAVRHPGEPFNGFRSRPGAPGLRYDRAALLASGLSTLGEFLQNISGLAVGNTSSAGSMQMSRSAATMSAVPGRPGVVPCHVGWFVDGHRMDSAAGIDQITDGLARLQLDDIDGVEIFRGLSEMPPEFATPDLQCGAIAVWTRRN